MQKVVFRKFAVAAGLGAGMAALSVAYTPGARAAGSTGPNAVTASSDNVYIWLDGSWERKALPAFDLGWKHIAGATNLGAAENFDPRVSGAGFSGGFGYKFKNGAFPTMFGDNFRVELGISYFSGKSSQSGSSSGSSYSVWGLDGSKQNSFGACPCSETSQLQNSLNTFQGSVALKGDYHLGSAILTPSITLFGGRTNNNQTFSQLFTSAIVSGIYSAQSDVRSTDWGTKIGLNADQPISRSVMIGIGGDIGTAVRSASMSASDQGSTAFFLGLTPVSASATKTPILASGNIHVSFMPMQNVTLRAFGGVNYDSQVAGIAASAIGTSDLAGNGPPADLRFAKEVGYFAGGGITVKFAP